MSASRPPRSFHRLATHPFSGSQRNHQLAGVQTLRAFAIGVERAVAGDGDARRVDLLGRNHEVSPGNLAVIA